MAAPKGHPNYDTEGLAGRPKRYTTEFCDAEAIELEKWLNEDKENMFIQSFCLKRGYPVFKIPEMLKVSQRFRQAYDMWRTRQQISLFAGGLNKKFAHPMCALILSHTHDIHLKTESKVTADVNQTTSDWMNQTDGNTKDLVNDV